MKLTNSLNKLPHISSHRRLTFFGLLGIFLSSLLFLNLFLAFPVSNISAQSTQTKLAILGKPNYPNPPLQYLIGYRQSTLSAKVKITDVVDNDGLAAFSFHIKYDPNLVTIADSNQDGIADEGVATVNNFLGSTGKQIECNDGFVEPDKTDSTKQNLIFFCASLGPTPAAPKGSGDLATINFTVGNTLGSSSLEFAKTELVDNTQSVNQIPHIKSSIAIFIMKCADSNGDGLVDLANDILGVIQHYNTTPASPNWNPVYDLDGNGYIDLANDILGTIFQYQMHCTY